MIYFVRRCGSNFVKVGFTAGDPLDRISTLQTSSAEELELMATAAGTVQDERSIHRRLADTRLEGEWFEMSPLLAEIIALADPEFASLAKLEPGIIRLAHVAGSVEYGPKFCANSVWYSSIKPDLVELIGWYRRKDKGPELSARSAYDLVYQRLYEILPGCRDCMCIRMADFDQEAA